MEEETVDDAFACPLCGEKRAARLVWDENWELVTCSMCGIEYEPVIYDSDEDDA